MNLKKLRQARKLSQFEIGTATGIGRFNYQLVEQGYRSLSELEAEKLAVILDLPTRTLRTIVNKNLKNPSLVPLSSSINTPGEDHEQ